MTSIDEIYPSKSEWLKSADLQGTVQRVTIESAVMGMVFDKPQAILTFSGKDKKFGCNLGRHPAGKRLHLPVSEQ